MNVIKLSINYSIRERLIYYHCWLVITHNCFLIRTLRFWFHLFENVSTNRMLCTYWTKAILLAWMVSTIVGVTTQPNEHDRFNDDRLQTLFPLTVNKFCYGLSMCVSENVLFHCRNIVTVRIYEQSLLIDHSKF